VDGELKVDAFADVVCHLGRVEEDLAAAGVRADLLVDDLAYRRAVATSHEMYLCDRRVLEGDVVAEDDLAGSRLLVLVQ